MSGSCGCENSNCKCAETEWVMDDSFERYPKWKQEEILNCKHDWHIEHTASGSSSRNCLKCGVPTFDKKEIESFSATVINKGKVPQGAIAKAMMNQAMIAQVTIESIIEELENKVNLGLISEDDLMKSLKKKFGAEYDIQVFNSRYGGSDCGKCGGSHKGICPDYGEEDEYTKCTDCKWDGANGNWNTVIEWCSSCKEKNEIYWKENAERIRLDKERKEQEEQDRIDDEKSYWEWRDEQEDRYGSRSDYDAESNRLSNPGQFREYMEELPFPDNMNDKKELGFLDKNGNTVEIYIGSNGNETYEEGILEWWVVSNKPLRPNQETEVKQFLNEYLKYHGVPEYEIIWRNVDDVYGPDVFITLRPLPAAEEKLWKSLWENKRGDKSYSHLDDFEIKNKARHEKIVTHLWIDEGLTMTPDEWTGPNEGVQFNPPFYVKAPNGNKVKCQFKYDFYSDEFFVLGDYYDNIEYDENDVPTGIPTIKTMSDKLATYGFHDLDFSAWNDQNTLLFIMDFSDSKDDSCSHDDFEIKIIEKDGSDYLLTFKCLGCKKVGSTSAELQDNEWMS